MRNIITFTILITILLLLPAIPINTATQATPQTIIYVDDDNTQGPWDGTQEHPYQHITDAITNATTNDTIYIQNGTYHEHATITKPLHIQGQHKNTTIITTDNHDTIFTLQANHITITDLTFQNSAGRPTTAAIDIHANHTTITNCILYRHRTAITITNHTNLTITNCMIHTTQQGLHAVNSSHIHIASTHLYHNAIGLLLRHSTDITITTTYLHTNGVACALYNDRNITINTSAFCDNNDNQGGLILRNTNTVTITDSYFINNGLGIGLKTSHTTTITHCTFERNTHFALKLWNTTSTTAQNCSFHDNIRNAVYAENSNLSLHHNLLQNDSYYGLYAINTTADAINNWWGSLLGPTFNSNIRRADRGSLPKGRLQYFPWLIQPPANTGTSWQIASVFTAPEHPDTWDAPLILPGTDTDGDYAPDWWENKWGYDPLTPDDHQHLDPDDDGLTNLQECYTDSMNSSPFHQDIFLEFDWLASITSNESNRPQDKYLDKMTAAFARHNITLHIDTGELGGGQELPARTDLTYEDIVNVYWDCFLNGDINSPRKGVFHYGLLCDTSSDGNGFAVMGWDDLDCFTISCQILQNNHPRSPRGYLTTAGSFHELGHNLDLIAARFDGIDNMATTPIKERGFWQYHNYHSLMNYAYTYVFMDYSDGSHGRNDFNDWAAIDLGFFKNTEFTLPR